MTWGTRRGLLLLGLGAVLGLLGDLLLRATPLGLNVGLWTAALVVIGVFGTSSVLGRWYLKAEDSAESPALHGEGRWLAVPAVLFALALAWRASEMLAFLNLAAALGCLALLALRGRAGRVVLASLSEYALAGVLAGLHAAGGALNLLFGEVEWRQVPRAGVPGLVFAILRGLAIAIPLLVVFGALFVSADAAFGGIVQSIFRIDLAALVGHLVFWGVLTWIVVGFLRQTLASGDWSSFGLPSPTAVALGGVEIGVALGLLDLLFLAFVVVQFRYLFGGAPLVEASTSLTYAEYARRGFFELVAVVALALPCLLVADWARKQSGPRRDLVIFRALALALVAMLFVVMASAVQRMLLYQQAYGLTELRLYASAFMVWLGLVVLWLVATVLLGRRNRFAFGALVAGFAVLGALNALNPDDLIARTNLARIGAPVASEAGQRPFDYQYTLRLSADAVPSLVEGVAEMSPAARTAVAREVLQRWGSGAAPSDWRTWSWGRTAAGEAVRLNAETLRALTRQTTTAAADGAGNG